MKKPKISHKDFNDNFDHVDKWEVVEYELEGFDDPIETYLDVNAVSKYGPDDTYSVVESLSEEDAKAISAVPEMIEALIEYVNSKAGPSDAYEKAKKALEKAGVEILS